MTAATPANRKLVHWDVNSPDMGSPSLSLPNDSTDSFVSTSSLQYINSQLVAHGFTSSPGLSLDGISNEDLNRVTKCLLDMLAQRMKDMSRAEQLTTELRTLTYDYERMKSMHQSASESAANFEREVNVQKSRLGTVTKNLQQAEQAHKQTMAELQRTRSALQTVRATHQAELRKKDKEFERMADKWSKIADAQTKLGAAASGMRFSGTGANASVVDGGQFGKGKGYLEVALDQAEKAREQVTLENTGLRMLLVRVANEVQRVTHEVKRYMPGTSQDAEEPPAFTLAALFPVSPADYTGDKLTSLLQALRQSLYDLEAYCRDTIALSSSTAKQPSASEEEIQRLKSLVETLQIEHKKLQECQSSESTKAQGSTESRPLAIEREAADGVAANKQEAERLDALKQELKDEKCCFTDATIRLRQEQVELEAEKRRFYDEKRDWQAEKMMLTDSPLAPEDLGSSSPPTKKRHSPHTEDALSKSKPKGTRSPRKVPGKSSLKVSIGRALATSRAGKRPSLGSSYSALTSPSKRPPKFEPAYETEVIPTPLLSSQLQPPPTSLLPTSFALPPPSPNATLPPQPPTLLLSTPFEIPLSGQAAPPEHVPNPSEGAKTDSPPAPAQVPETPQPAGARSPHMIHAYSPARPSPLSRILMLGNSPDNMNPVLEAEAEEWTDMDEMFPEIKDVGPPMSLAQELGVSESPPESPVAPPPLRKKSNGVGAGQKKTATVKGRVVRDPPEIKSRVGSKSTSVQPSSKPPARTMMKSLPAAVAKTSGRPVGTRTAEGKEKEKENSGTRAANKVTSSEESKPAAVTAAPRPRLKIPPSGAQAGAGRSAPRRVPIGSAEAPPVTQGKKS
uniref:Afadin and alpha-actinin-binding-domain-containing protein n=1 Tax=Moniliophthora roreri TaxID=221103 RepID=A0A0W0G6R5_MONRR